jgi:hypothetical protein
VTTGEDREKAGKLILDLSLLLPFLDFPLVLLEQQGR